MDLHGVRELVRPVDESEIPAWQPGDAYVAGGTWLFSERQPGVTRLVDLSGLPWRPILGGVGDAEVVDLRLAGTCTYRDLERAQMGEAAAPAGAAPAAAAPGKPAVHAAHRSPGAPGTPNAHLPLGTPGPLGTLGPLLAAAVRSLSSSFKTWEVATVGGNLCLAYAKSMMAPVMIAARATYRLLSPAADGAPAAERLVPAEDFQTGVCRTIRRPGEYLREVIIPAGSLTGRYALERLSYTPTSHATGLVIARRGSAPALLVSAATAFPVARSMPAESDEQAVRAAVLELLDSAPALDDAHGGAAYRRQVLPELAWRAWRRAGEEA